MSLNMYQLSIASNELHVFVRDVCTLKYKHLDTWLTGIIR